MHLPASPARLPNCCATRRAARRATRRATVLAALHLLAGSAALAQPAPQRVEVVGTSPLPGLDMPKDRVPANVQTARSSDIEASGASDLAAFMQRRLGSVHINEVQNNPFQPDVNFRGFTASPLLGSAQGLSVYLDGVRLNQPFGDVVSWDLIPKSAIASIALMPGSNPLFGLNTLGGALSVTSKDGLKNPGTSLQLLAGSGRRAALEFETGGSRADDAAGQHLHWFVTGQRFQETGWRDSSPSDVGQLFAKLGGRLGDARVSLSAALADNSLNGNGLQEQRLLQRSRAGVYTRPDTTHNRSALLNLAATQSLSDTLWLSGNVYWRQIRTNTLNGDVNSAALGQDVLLDGTAVAERAALAAAGFTGLPGADESPANTPFPKWRCIAQALLRDTPALACNGLLNRSATDQSNHGLAAQLNWQGRLAGMDSQALLGAALDLSRVQFRQSSELGTLKPDHNISGVGVFADGVSAGTLDGVPLDSRVDLAARTRTGSLLASGLLALNTNTHLTLAGRYNRSTVKSRDAITPGGGPGSLDGEHQFSRFNPAIGLTWAASPQLTVYGGANQGSRAPSAVELGCADPQNPCKLPNAMAGDPPLKQVVTTTLELGLRGSTAAGWAWNVGVFSASNQDDILFVADNVAGYGYFKNFGKTRRQGLEAGLSTTLAGISLGANYTLIDATFRSAELLGGAANSSNSAAQAGLPGTDGNIPIQPGKRIPLVPRQQLKLFAQVPLGAAWQVGADVSALSSALARGNENNAHTPDGIYYLGSGRSAGYALLNLRVDWRPAPALGVFLLLNNALGRRYSSAAQLGATAFDAQGHFVAQPFAANASGARPLLGSTFFAPGAPRSVQLGVKYSFGV